MILWKWNALERRTYPVSLWHPMSSGRMRWVLFVASMLRLTRTVPAAPVGRGDSSAVAVNTAVSSDRWRGIAERYLWCTTHWHRVPGAASWAPAAGLRVAAGAGDAYDTIYRDLEHVTSMQVGVDVTPPKLDQNWLFWTYQVYVNLREFTASRNFCCGRARRAATPNHIV